MLKAAFLGPKIFLVSCNFLIYCLCSIKLLEKKLRTLQNHGHQKNVSPFVVLQTQINTRLRESLKLEKPVVVIVSHRTCFEFVRTTDAVVRLLQKRNQFGLPAVFRLFVVSC